MHRIVTLLPSATEIVCALGFENELVGRSHECDYPAGVAKLPALTEPKFKLEGTSAEIDQRVKQIVGDALSVYRVDAKRLRDLRPDVIVTQSQCEVCAVSEREVEAAVAAVAGPCSPGSCRLRPMPWRMCSPTQTRREGSGSLRARRCADRANARPNGLDCRARQRARYAPDVCLYRVDRSDDVGGQLDARAWRRWQVATIFSAAQASIRRG